MSPHGWAVPIVSLGAAVVVIGGIAPVAAAGHQSQSHPSYGPVSYPGNLQSVTAVSASDVWAVGFHDDSQEISSTLIEHWDGHVWSQVASPRFGGSGGSQLFGVGAASASDVWAVGNAYSGTEFDTLIEHWDGTSWSTVASPSPGGANGSYLFAVSARSATDAWAVGQTYDGPLIEHWDGSTWTQVTSPGGTGTELSGVTAISATDAVAVGETFGAFSRQFILRWDGTTWMQVKGAPTDKRGHGETLNGVSASSATDVWAVGTSTHYRKVVDTSLIEHWDGTSWQRVTGLDPGGRFGTQLNGVSAVAPDDVWAVGSYGFQRSGASLSFIEHWNGTSWKKTHASSPGGKGSSTVSAVSALSPSQAWAAGSYVNATTMTMTQNWDGQRWIQL